MQSGSRSRSWRIQRVANYGDRRAFGMDTWIMRGLFDKSCRSLWVVPMADHGRPSVSPLPPMAGARGPRASAALA
eukprot:540963-Pyramimonas_sp.AAC.1